MTKLHTEGLVLIVKKCELFQVHMLHACTKTWKCNAFIMQSKPLQYLSYTCYVLTSKVSLSRKFSGRII